MFGSNKVLPDETQGMPVAMAVPVEDGAPPVAEMTADDDLYAAGYAGMGESAGEGGPWETLERTNRYRIVQHPQHLEALGQMCCGSCWEMANQYVVLDADTGAPLLNVRERSDLLERMCCSPQHSLVLEVYDARENAAPGRLVFTARKDLQLFHCFSCVECCRGRLDVFDAQGAMIGKVMEPSCMAASVSPKLEIMERDDPEPFLVTEGPVCCVGGCMELCSEINFKLINPHDQGDHAQVGQIVKEAPSGCCEAMTQASTQADRFLVEFPGTEKGERRALIVANALLTDYMFFENGAVFRRKPNGKLEVHVANIYCYGCLCPCVASLGNK